MADMPDAWWIVFMQDALKALVAASKSQMHPRMLALIFWPFIGSVLFWGTLSFFFWHGWHQLLAGWVEHSSLQESLAKGFFAIVAGYVVTFVLIVFLASAVYMTSLLVTSLIAMPVMVEHVAASCYPGLARKHGGSLAGSLLNSLLAVSIFMLAWLFALPFWLFTPLAPLVSLLLSAFLGQRLFRYDALSEHASQQEFRRLLQQSSGKFYLLGLITGLVQFVPLLNLIAVTWIGLAFVHLGLAELSQLRDRDLRAHV